MTTPKPLPNYLIKRYHGWKETSYAQNASWFQRLAKEGQQPPAMVISCCDSRVHVTSIFGAEQGEFFIHRNIANFVPPNKPEAHYQATSAALEYAVTSLHVSHIIVLGHSSCGGVAGCLAMCEGNAPQLEAETSFVGRWVEQLKPGYERIKSVSADTRHTAFEKEAVLLSIENLKTFPFVKDAVDAGKLSLHGLWTDIGEGGLEHYVPGSGFVPV